MKKELGLKIIFILSIIGILVSLYLVQNHYNPPSEGAFCDLSETASCSLVNTSIYSELLNVPIALFGVLWFAVLALASWKAKKNNGALLTGIGLWSALGFLFIIYTIIAEILLLAICPFCTILHVFIIIILIITIILLAKEKKSKKKKLWKKLKPWVIGIVILFLIPIILFNLPREKEDFTDFAKCLDEKGVNMYGSFRCGVCAKTRKLFGEAFEFIKEIECHPLGKNPQTELCTQKKIRRTPHMDKRGQWKRIGACRRLCFS